MNFEDLKNVLLTKENLTFALSVIGSAGTAYTFLKNYISNRKHLKIKICKSVYNKSMKSLILYFSFENKSHLPIAICDVKIKYNNKVINSVEFPAHVSEYTHKHGKEVVDRIFIYNLEFPCDINYLSAKCGYVLFDIPQEELEDLATPLIVQVYSTRGLVQRIALKPDLIKYCESPHVHNLEYHD